MNIYNLEPLSLQDEDDLWHTATIVFDTSALCNLYDLTDHYRETMVTILTYLKDRVWIPYHVKVEYLHNRKKAINNPRVEKYHLPDVANSHFVIAVRNCIKEWENNAYYHPYLEKDKLALLKNEIEEANKHIRKIKNTIKEQYAKRCGEIKALENNDPLLTLVNGFTTGVPYSFSEIKDIIKEGDFRYRNQLPPGYEDALGKEGIRRYGDLIIWKSIMAYAKDKEKDIILVTNDCKKDWVIQEGQFKGFPLPELLTEFKEGSNHKIWFYTSENFIERLKALYGKNPQELPLFDTLDNVAYALGRIARERQLYESHQGEQIQLKCEQCGQNFSIWSNDLDLEWENQSFGDREMGEEIEWCSDCSLECPECGNQVDLSFYAYEYPVGVYSEGSIDCDGAELLNDPKIEKICPISEYYDSLDVCCKCGEHTEIDDMGLCENCRREYEDYINSEK